MNDGICDEGRLYSAKLEYKADVGIRKYYVDKNK